MLLSFVIVAFVLAVWALSAGRLQHWRITAPLFLVVAGALVEYCTHSTLADNLNSETAQHIAEIILAVLLFVDANAIRGGMFGEYPRAATRLLFIALPLSMALAVLLGSWLLPGLSVATLVVIACIVVPIDFAPAPSIVRDRNLPARVRDLLNVEAGYGDGIISPIFVFALIVADLEAEHDARWEAVVDAFPHAAKAVVIGLCVGGGLALAANYADRHGLMTVQSQRILTVATPALAYTASLGVHANGFVAAFLCGVGYRYFRRTEDPERDLELIEDISFLLTAAMWFVFGGVALIAFWKADMTVGLAVFCLLALTVVRMVPVVVAMTGSRFSWPERLLVGWLGPRGVAAIVLGLLAFNVLEDPDEHIVLLTTVVMVLGSVLLHGFGAQAAAHAFARSRTE